MDIDEKLREQSKVLLQKLKAKQGRLQQMLSSSAHEKKNNDPVDTTVEIRSNDTTKRSDTEAIQHYDQETVRQTLKQNGRSQLKASKPNQIQIENKENFNQTSHVKRGFKPKEVIQEDSNRGKLHDPSIVYKKASSDVRYDGKSHNATGGVMQNDVKRKYPLNERNSAVSERRNLISRNVLVEGEEVNDIPTNGGLNFSYSRFDESDLDFVKSCMDDSENEKTPARYYNRLEEAGNDKKAAKLVQESFKPKSILQTTGPKSLKKASTL
jgi:hypothetical protein